MWDSLQKLRRLPASARVYCAHEYTNRTRFALSIEAITRSCGRGGGHRRAAGAQEPTVPSPLARRWRPILPAGGRSALAQRWLSNADPVEVFAEVRARKDSF